MWTAETVPGVYVVTVTAEDGKGGTATDTVNIEVFRRVIAFGEVFFDLNQSVLRPEARTALDEAARAMKENPGLRVQIQGNTSNEASEVYNFALGERRAIAVRDYLVLQGVDVTRMGTISYGETRPKYDNANPETRPMNRRADIAPADGN